MKIIPELKKIAGRNESVKRLAEKLPAKIDCDRFRLEDAYFVTGCKESGGHLYQGDRQLDIQGLTGDLYYCKQYAGYCEDDYHGTMYFKTNVPGQFVAVPFETW